MKELLRWDSVWETRVGGREEIRLPEKRTVLHQHTERPEGVKAKNSSWIFLFSLSLSRFLALPPPRLSPPHLVVVIHHGISKPFKAPAQKWRLRSPCIIAFREVPPSLLNLLDSLSLAVAVCMIKRQGKSPWDTEIMTTARGRKSRRRLQNVHEITSVWFAVVLFILFGEHAFTWHPFEHTPEEVIEAEGSGRGGRPFLTDSHYICLFSIK